MWNQKLQYLLCQILSHLKRSLTNYHSLQTSRLVSLSNIFLLCRNLNCLAQQVNGRLVLEGVLRIFWGVQRSIRVKEFEDKRVIAKRPMSCAIMGTVCFVYYYSSLLVYCIRFNLVRFSRSTYSLKGRKILPKRFEDDGIRTGTPQMYLISRYYQSTSTLSTTARFRR